MYRRFLVAFFRRAFATFLLICLGCSAQSTSPELSRKIERQVRSFYSIPARVKVNLGALHPSEFPNYDALTITLDGGEKKSTYDFLLSKDGNTLIRQIKMDLSKDPFAETMKKMDLSNRPVRGSKGAKVVAVNYDDFQCPYCSRMHQTLFPQLLKEYGDRVEFIYKDFPLSEIHPWAMHAAVDSNCLAAQNTDAYWDFADYVHNNQREFNSQKGHDEQFAALDRVTVDQGQKHALDIPKLQACLKTQDETAIKVSVKEAEDLGVDGTPALFINGQKVEGGALPIEDLRAILDRALVDAGATPPAHPAGQSTGSGGQ
jgi:protein-disulfide isomerase